MKGFIFALLAIFVLGGCGNDKGKFIIQNTSSKSLEETTTALKKALENETFTVIDVIEHKKTADENNITIQPQKIVTFTKPNVAYTLMACNPSMGMEIPFKILVWQSYEGKVSVEYVNPEYWSLTHNIKDKNCLKAVNQTTVAIKKAVDKSLK